MRSNNNIRMLDKIYIKKTYIIYTFEYTLFNLGMEDNIQPYVSNILDTIDPFYIEVLTDPLYSDTEYSIFYDVKNYVKLYLLNHEMISPLQEYKTEFMYTFENTLSNVNYSKKLITFFEFAKDKRTNLILMDYMKAYPNFYK